ncbi:ABC transporter substrate-binding protein [Alloalcanivorax gelatiniphagus]
MRRLVSLTASACLIASVSACSAREDDAAAGADGCSPGITDTSVHLGSSVSMSGAAAAVGAIAEAGSAYFDQINADGGVTMGDGTTRTIDFEVLDDAYDPARTVSNVRRLVEQEDVFALHSVTGTGPVLAVTDYAKAQGVPLVFPVSGSDQFGEVVADGVPLAGVSQPDISWEADLWVRHAVESDPDATFAILSANDGYGNAGAEGAKAAIEELGADLVAEQDYEQSAANVDSQVAQLKDSGATVLLSITSASFQTQALARAADIGWYPTTYIPATGSDVNIVAPAGADATKDLYSLAWLRDVSDDADTSEGMTDWREFADANGLDDKSFLAAIGYTNAQFLVKALEAMPGCTRDDLLEAVRGAEDFTPALGMPGVTFEGVADYPNIITGLALVKFDGEHWDATGDVYQQ